MGKNSVDTHNNTFQVAGPVKKSVQAQAKPHQSPGRSPLPPHGLTPTLQKAANSPESSHKIPGSLSCVRAASPGSFRPGEVLRSRNTSVPSMSRPGATTESPLSPPKQAPSAASRPNTTKRPQPAKPPARPPLKQVTTHNAQSSKQAAATTKSARPPQKQLSITQWSRPLEKQTASIQSPPAPTRSAQSPRPPTKQATTIQSPSTGSKQGSVPVSSGIPTNPGNAFMSPTAATSQSRAGTTLDAMRSSASPGASAPSGKCCMFHLPTRFSPWKQKIGFQQVEVLCSPFCDLCCASNFIGKKMTPKRSYACGYQCVCPAWNGDKNVDIQP